MAFDVEAAKADGYTDEEIAAHLRGQANTPVPVQEQPGRTAEVAATAVGTVPTVASYVPEAVVGYGLYKYGPDIARTAGNIVSKMSNFNSAPSSTLGTPSNPIGGPVAPPAMPPAAPAMPQPQPGMVDQASNIVKKLALSKLLPAAQVGMGLFYTSPEEIATLKAAEELRKRQGLPR